MYPRILIISLLIFAPAIAVLADGAPKSAHATIVNAQGANVGSAQISSTANGVKIALAVSELTPGEHGIHIHTSDKCEAPAFTSAGSHFNPTNAHHGIHNAQGPNPHLGDLGNLKVDASGKAKASFSVEGVTLGEGANSLFHEGGTSLVIHAKADDLMSDPSGNSGDRIACGAIEK